MIRYVILCNDSEKARQFIQENNLPKNTLTYVIMNDKIENHTLPFLGYRDLTFYIITPVDTKIVDYIMPCCYPNGQIIFDYKSIYSGLRK